MDPQTEQYLIDFLQFLAMLALLIYIWIVDRASQRRRRKPRVQVDNYTLPPSGAPYQPPNLHRPTHYDHPTTPRGFPPIPRPRRHPEN